MYTIVIKNHSQYPTELDNRVTKVHTCNNEQPKGLTMNLAAAQAARTATAMSRRNIDVDGIGYTVTELMDEGRLAYVRTRIMRDGKRAYGIILHDEVMKAHKDYDRESLAEALAYVSYYEVPKMVGDHLHAEGISRVVFSTWDDTYAIEYAA
jgi:hypothetical protein